MAGNATLTIKVGANVRDAAQQLQALGYNVETVKKKTDKANESASIWSQTIKKGSEDNIRKIVELGAKYMTLTTVITGVYRGIKSCVSEALKENEEAQKKIDAINSAWTEVKTNLGSALLDSITPALEGLLGMLNKISKWTEQSKKNASFNSIANAAYEGYKGSGVDFSIYSLDSLKYFQSNYTDLFNNGYEGWVTNAGEDASTMYHEVKKILDAEIAAREALSEATVSVTETPGASSGGVDKDIWKTVLGYSDKYTTHGKKALLQSYMDYAQNVVDSGYDTQGFYADAIEGLQAQIDKLGEAKESWDEYFSNILDKSQLVFSELSSLSSNWFTLRETMIENSTDSEEEKAKKLEELGRKEFIANQVNATAEATMSYAQGMIDIWSKYASSPVMAGILTGLLTANTGVQFATIANQSYTGLAEGGIVQSPTHALIGEGAEKEAVIPLSKLEDFVDRGEGGVINLSISINGNASADDVYYAIERAQRTGLLPHWRYA